MVIESGKSRGCTATISGEEGSEVVGHKLVMMLDDTVWKNRIVYEVHA